MKKFKKALSILLCLVLMAGILPVSVLADGGKVAKIGDTEYATLDAAVAVANDDDTIVLLGDCTLTNGLIADTKTLTIEGTGKTGVKLMLTNLGIYAKNLSTSDSDHKYLTFKNCNLDIQAKDNPSHNGQTASLIKNYDLIFDNCNVSITNPENGVAHGIFFYKNSNLYVKNGSTLEISGFNAKGCSGIYIDDSEYVDMPTNVIEISNNSSLIIADCCWNGMTVNPTNIIVDGYSKLNISDCGKNGGRGGLGCYCGKLTVSNYSNANFDDNVGGSWGAFVMELDVDGTSTLSACRNTAHGLEVGGKGTIQTNATIKLDDNHWSGLVSYANTDFWVGDVEIKSGAKVSVKNNAGGIQVMSGAALDMAAGIITNNGTTYRTTAGGGILVGNNGVATIGSAVALYNNHASEMGDDIYSEGKITFADVGSDWYLDDCTPNDLIDGWYEDGLELTDGLTHRWDAHGDPTYIVKKESGSYEAPLAYKAAHGESVIPAFGIPILWLNMEDHYSYIIGYPDGTVQPNGKITRAEVATIFFRLLSDDTREAFWSSTNSYSDVTADKWYNNAVSTLSRLGVISGYPDGTFRPDASITRAEFAKIAVSFCKYGSTTYSGCFSDVKASDWFSTCVETARNSNLIAGYPDGTFRPNNAITRAEACTIVNRTLGRKPAKNHMAISGRINWPDCLDAEWFYADMMEATNSHDYQMVGLVEDWNRKLPQRDWAALETEWSHAYSAPGGEVGR